MKYFMVGLLIVFLALPGYSQIPIKKKPTTTTKPSASSSYNAHVLLLANTKSNVNINGQNRGQVEANIPKRFGVAVGDNVLMLTPSGGGSPKIERVSVDRGKQKLVEVNFSGLNTPKPSPTNAPATKANRADLPDMVFVQGGTFQMGDQFGDGGSSEKPVHSVTVSDFYMSNHEVTFSEYAEYCAANGIALPDDEGWGRGNRPVINVSWYDAVKYCNWRSAQEGLRPVYRISGSDVSADWTADGYRLPTEAEWEYAARSRGKKEKWAGTSSESSLKEYANFNENIGKTQPVKSYEPNGLGLYDMSGNVWEWCWDRYDSNYYASSKNASDPKGPGTGSNRVYRGGSWFNSPRICRAALRGFDDPSSRNSLIGFRLALSSR